jgi:hypothetical protein
MSSNGTVVNAIGNLAREVSRAAERSRHRARESSVRLASTVVARSLTQLHRLEGFLRRAVPDAVRPRSIPPAPDSEPRVTARPSERPAVEEPDYEAIAPEDLGLTWLENATEAPARRPFEAQLVENLVVEGEMGAALIGDYSLEASRPSEGAGERPRNSKQVANESETRLPSGRSGS